MKSLKFPTGFNTNDMIMSESPLTFSFFESNKDLKKDLNELFEYFEDNKDNMPFYIFSEKEVKHIAETSEGVYDALCSALDWISKNKSEIPTYFGKEFCEKYPEFIEYALWTYKNSHEAIYGRFDMAMNPSTGKITGVYEFNGNTPVMLFESTTLQNWLVNQVNIKNNTNYGQHNEYYESSVNNVFKAVKHTPGEKTDVGILAHTEYIEDLTTCENIFQMFDNAPGCDAYINHIDNIVFDPSAIGESPFSMSGIKMNNMFVLQPWEEIVESCYNDIIRQWRRWSSHVNFFEPAWRWFLANKGIWAVITHLMETDKEYHKKYAHLPLIRTYLTPKTFISESKGYVEKPINGRLSNNIVIRNPDNSLMFESTGSYEGDVCIYQEYVAPGKTEGRNNFIVGQWMSLYNEANEEQFMQASCLCIREFDKPVLDIKNERFIPHLITPEEVPMFSSKLDEAHHVVDWHMFSDKTTDKKLSDMPLEEAEAIIANSK